MLFRSPPERRSSSSDDHAANSKTADHRATRSSTSSSTCCTSTASSAAGTVLSPIPEASVGFQGQPGGRGVFAIEEGKRGGPAQVNGDDELCRYLGVRPEIVEDDGVVDRVP